MAFGKKSDDGGADLGSDETGGHYAVESLLDVGNKRKLTRILNERWEAGWRLVRTQESGQLLLAIFERRDQ
jgi:hypothetical protein